MKKYDVLIVGGGPSGSTLAYRLARSGVSVAVLEKERMPRVKPCGGALDQVFLRNLPEGMSLDGVVEDEVHTVRFRHKEHKANYRMAAPLLMTQRRLLDACLLEQAGAAGATVMEGVRARDFHFDGDSHLWRVPTGAGDLLAGLLVGADGAYSTVARQLGFRRRVAEFIAMECEVKIPWPTHGWWGVAHMDASARPLGYGWMFPKGDHLNIGWGVPRRFAKQLRGRVQALVESYSAKDTDGARAHLIPMARRVQVVKGPALLVGDAAGAVDPATGSGIGWGVATSRLAHEAITIALTGSSPLPEALELYQSYYDRHITTHFRAAEALRNLIALSLLTRGREPASLFRVVLGAISGQESYVDWARANPAKYRLGRLLQPLVDRLA